MSQHDVEAYRRLFPTQHIPVILHSIVQAGRTLQKKTDHDREDELTRRLHSQLIRIPQFRDGPLDIRLQPKIPAPTSDPNDRAGRIDLLVSCGLGHEVYFAIEAKRLRVRSPNGRTAFRGHREYVTEGMVRFITGRYAPQDAGGCDVGICLRWGDRQSAV